MNQKGFIPALLIILVLGVVLGGFLAYKIVNKNPSSPPPNQTACTLEAKICPDGSSVVRVGPNCEFEKCPTPKKSTESADISEWEAYTNTKYGYSLKYPPDWKLSFGRSQLGTDGDETNLETTDLIKINPLEQPEGYWAVFVEIRKTDFNTPEEVLDDFKKPRENSGLGLISNQERTTLDGNQAFSYQSSGPGQTSSNILSIKEGYVYIVSLDLLSSAHLMPIYYQIISTFRFN